MTLTTKTTEVNTQISKSSSNFKFDGKTKHLRLSHAFGLLFFVILTFWLTWPVLPNANRSLEQWGDALLQTYTLDWDVHAFTTDPLHLFNANVFYPYQNSLAFSESLIGQAFLVTPLILLTNNPVLGFNVLLLLSFILSGWGTYLLVYDLTGSRGAGLVSGVIFAFFPNRFTQFSHLHLLATEWMPFCLLFLRRFFKDWRWRNGICFGICFVMELLSSTYLGLFLVVCVGLYFIFSGLRYLLKLRATQLNSDALKSGEAGGIARTSSKFPHLIANLNLNKIGRLLLILVLCSLVVLPFLKPYFDVKSDLGFDRSQAEVENWSAAPNYYLDLFKFNRLNEQFLSPVLKSLKWWEVGGGERQLYLGITAMVLGLVGLGAVWRRRKIQSDGIFYVLLGLVAFTFTFGPILHTSRFGDLPLPYWLLYNFLPGFQALRVPVRFIYVVALALAVVAGFGVSALIPRIRLRPLFASIAFGVVSLLVTSVFGINILLALLIGAAACGVSLAFQSNSNLRKLNPTTMSALLLVSIILGLLCFEYATDVSLKESDALQSPPPAAKWLSSHPGPVLNVPLSGTNYTDMFYMYWSRLGWQPVMNGSSGFMPPAYDSLRTAWSTEFPSGRLLTLLQGLEIRYLVIDSENPEVQPTWNKVQKSLQNFPQLKLATQLGGVFIYELQSDPWLRNLHSTIKPNDPLYLVEYRRNQPQLLELAAYFLERIGVSEASSFYGNINIADRALPVLPSGQPARYALIQSGEDPTLYGFNLSDKKWSNALVDFYQQDNNLLARYDFSRSANTRTSPISIKVQDHQLLFDSNNLSGGNEQNNNGESGYLRLGLASLVSQTVTLSVDGQDYPLNLTPGLSVYRTRSIILQNNPKIEIKNTADQPYLLTSAELWQTSVDVKPELTLQRNVVLVQNNAFRDGGSGVANLKIVMPGTPDDKYTATLDVYSRPYGSNPQGHYGYWSVALEGGKNANLQFKLDLAQKKMQTFLNDNTITNYPPDPKDLDISRYAKLGDFRASINLYRGSDFVGSVQLFNFTVNGDKNDAMRRYVSDFSVYNTSVNYLVLK